MNELAEEKWTPIVKRKEMVATMTEPIISSDKELSLASAQEIKNSNILDGIGVPQDSYRSSLIAPQTRQRNKY